MSTSAFIAILLPTAEALHASLGGQRPAGTSSRAAVDVQMKEKKKLDPLLYTDSSPTLPSFAKLFDGQAEMYQGKRATVANPHTRPAPRARPLLGSQASRTPRASGRRGSGCRGSSRARRPNSPWLPRNRPAGEPRAASPRHSGWGRSSSSAWSSRRAAADGSLT